MPKQLPLPIKGLVFALFFALVSFTANAQKTVVGKVAAGADNHPVEGATVTIKGTKMATQTDANGTYKITVPNDQSILVVTAVGFETIELSTSGKTDVPASLVQAQTSLNEVVVIGYGTQKRKDVSGSISSITAATIDKVPVTTLDQALQGRAAGVQVTNNDASPGASVSVLVRGIGSLASNGNAPLYVVDGYPTTGGINNINPNDIATIDVLKDASATAVYGIRAANGVVIITTKKGFKNKVQVSVDAYTAFQSSPRQYKLLNAQQFATLSNEVEAADSTHTYHGLPIWQTPSALHNVDWQDAVYRSGLSQNYSVSIRGGNDKVQSAVSFGYNDPDPNGLFDFW